MMNCKAKKTRGKNVLNLEGELTIIHSSEIRDLLLKAINKSKHVELNLDSVTDTDLSFLQLLCSAHRTAMKLNKSFSIKGGYPEILNETAVDAGFPLQKGCKLDCDNSCLWLEGNIQ
jgi:anti-anti-sigma regulatory factor